MDDELRERARRRPQARTRRPVIRPLAGAAAATAAVVVLAAASLLLLLLLAAWPLQPAGATSANERRRAHAHPSNYQHNHLQHRKLHPHQHQHQHQQLRDQRSNWGRDKGRRRGHQRRADQHGHLISRAERHARQAPASCGLRAKGAHGRHGLGCARDAHTRAPGRLAKRQAAAAAAALNETITRLHILESLDEQLRAFAEAAELAQQQQQQQRQRQQPVGAPYAAGARADWQAARGRNQSGVRWRDFHCRLQVEAAATNQRPAEPDAAGVRRAELAPNACLHNKRLLGQIPPFMLNLYRQLLLELQQTNLSFSETVQQIMPYRAQIMRSFRQPKLRLAAPAPADEARAAGQIGGELPARKDQSDDKRPDRPVLAVGSGPADGAAAATDDDEEEEEEPTAIGDVAVELSLLDGGELERAPEFWTREGALAAEREQRAPAACRPGQRLLAAHERDEICFWFKLDARLGDLIAPERTGRTDAGAGAHDEQQELTAAAAAAATSADGPREWPPERLVEAELHVFKLFPQSAPSPPASSSRDSPLQVPGAGSLRMFAQEAQGSQRGAAAAEDARAHAGHQAAAATTNRSATSPNGAYHLKTNLLEVSLYQILPRRATTHAAAAAAAATTTTTSTTTTTGGARELPDDEFPLRLLDIRRIDLNSNGWETFYVKRAVEDWLRDARLNLGLVIKAKSMFDEPVRAGLIRFADAYDQLADAGRAPSVARDFSVSHQPLLVIYTTRRARVARA